MKRTVSVLLTVCMLLGLAVWNAAADEEDFDHMIAGGVAVITNYAGAQIDVVIPATLSGCPVGAIESDVFSANKALRSVVLPDSITEIADEQFAWCTSLTNITFGSRVQRIGVSAFSGCAALTAMTVPDSVTTIGAGAFQDCTSLQTLTIGSGVTAIPGDLCNMCTSLRTVHCGQNVTSFGRSAFDGCFWNGGDLYLGEHVNNLPDNALDIDFHGTIHCFSDTALFQDLIERDYDVCAYTVTGIEVRLDAPLIVLRADTPQTVPQNGVHIYAVYESMSAAPREVTSGYTILDSMTFDKTGTVQIPVRFGDYAATYPVTVTEADLRITDGSTPVQGSLKKKIGLFSSYRRNPVQLGFSGVDAQCVQRADWRVTEGPLQVGSDGKVTYSGWFAATGVVQLTITDTQGGVHTASLRVVFYRFNLQMLLKFAKYR